MELQEMVIIQPKAGKEFVETLFVKEVIGRALHYLKAGFPVHLRGISGTGKTTLALRMAELMDRPVLMLHGDEQLTTSDLVGSETGYHMKKVRDNFIASVLKVEEETSKRWVDNRLTVAVENGYTLRTEP
jgi:gas vesicle protein GvpN